MKNSFDRNQHRKIHIQRPTIHTSEDEKKWVEVQKYAQLIPSEPEPNMGRLQEIKDEIRKGTYLTPEVIEETIARLAVRFMTSE